VEKRLIGSVCYLGGEWGQSRMGVLDGPGGDHRRGKVSFGVNVGHLIITNGDFVA